MDLLDLFQLLWQVLVGGVELEIGLKVHLGALLEEVGSDQSIHVHAVLLLLLATLANHLLRRVLLEVFELELFFLDELTLFSGGCQFIPVSIRLFFDVLSVAMRVFILALELGDQVGAFQIAIPGGPLLVILLKPGLFCLVDSHFSALN